MILDIVLLSVPLNFLHDPAENEIEFWAMYHGEVNNNIFIVLQAHVKAAPQMTLIVSTSQCTSKYFAHKWWLCQEGLVECLQDLVCWFVLICSLSSVIVCP